MITQSLNFGFSQERNLLFIIFEMEESLKKLIAFLNQICEAETEADEYRIKLTSDSSLAENVFSQVDKVKSGKITSKNICDFCQ